VALFVPVSVCVAGAFWSEFRCVCGVCGLGSVSLGSDFERCGYQEEEEEEGCCGVAVWLCLLGGGEGCCKIPDDAVVLCLLGGVLGGGEGCCKIVSDAVWSPLPVFLLGSFSSLFNIVLS